MNEVSNDNDKIHAWARLKSCRIWTAFESRECKCLASQEFISNATVMTLSTISSVEAFFILHGSTPIATLALWMVLKVLQPIGGLWNLILGSLVI